MLGVSPVDESAASMSFQVGKRVLIVPCAYAQLSWSQWVGCWRTPCLVTTLFYWGISPLVWAVVLRPRVVWLEGSIPDLNVSGVLLLEFCANGSFSITPASGYYRKYPGGILLRYPCHLSRVRLMKRSCGSSLRPSPYLWGGAQTPICICNRFLLVIPAAHGHRSLFTTRPVCTNLSAPLAPN